ncbi:MAG: transcription-repair coupling factor [Rickettsiaceae bacterium]|nr:transcription-repair coupling factor [Rickettsiaceae bacterium]
MNTSENIVIRNPLESYSISVFEGSQDILLLYPQSVMAKDIWRQLKFFVEVEKFSIYFLPDLNFITQNHSTLKNLSTIRYNLLQNIASDNSPKIIVTTFSNLFCKIPQKTAFANNNLLFSLGQKINIVKAAKTLAQFGYYKNDVITTCGEFAIRGDIIDVYSVNNAYRINIEWDEIKNIKIIDPVSQLSQDNVDKIILQDINYVTPEKIEFAKIKLLQLFGYGIKEHNIFKKLQQGNLAAELFYPLLSLFYDTTENIISYLNTPLIVTSKLYKQNLNQIYSEISKGYQPTRFLLNQDSIFFNIEDVNQLLQQYKITPIERSEANSLKSSITRLYLEHGESSSSIIKELCNGNKDKKLIFCANDKEYMNTAKTELFHEDKNLQEIEHISEAKAGQINLVNIAIQESCLLDNKYIVLSAKDFLTEPNVTDTDSYSNFRRLQNVLAEIDTLKENDLVVHKKHGIGRYLKIESVSAYGFLHDCIKIKYDGDDVLYVPVENINAIKKYGITDATLDKLGSVIWQKRSNIQRELIGELAKELVKIAAERKLLFVENMEVNEELYTKFCKAFPYRLTQDQVKAIEDIKSDLSAGRLMDRLLCGDVGFGKTEVIMHASFFVSIGNVFKKSQVVVLVPTMTLVRQHYKSFCKRFEGLDINIVQLSRLVDKKEVAANKLKIADGTADIIIGTHALLADNISFCNLGLLIVDEEQSFGVKQKEKLKQFSKELHSLSVSATPIPRTLQISIAGIKDLSLIATAPVNRMPIKTITDSYNEDLVKAALLEEKQRGGVSFYVCPRIEYLEIKKQELNKLVPQLSLKMLHGKMKPTEIEETLNDFYENKYDILLSTNIIESGLDVQNANTIIIDKVELLGLSQLYQLRGRIGRGNIQGYAYLLFSSEAQLTENAIRRVEVMQNIDYLGAGFTIANHDMDIRGFGNILGKEQAGHIKDVGVGLYQEMLDEAILEVQNKQQTQDVSTDDISIGIALPIYVPEIYISNQSIRLAIYQRLGALRSENEITKFVSEMIDRFGPIPNEMNNLIEILRIKHTCKNLGIVKLDAGSSFYSLKLIDGSPLIDKLLKFSIKFPNKIQIKPDNKVIINSNLNEADLIKRTKEFLYRLNFIE